MADDLTYDDAFKQLNEILEEIQGESVSIDTLADKIKKAKELKDFCQTRLRSIEEDLDQLT